MTEWRVVRLRRLFARPIGGTWGSDVGEADLDVACVRGTDFDTLKLRVAETRLPRRSITEAEWMARRLQRGDIVIEKSGGGEQQPVGRAVLFDLDRDAVPTNFAARLRPAKGYDPQFLTYLLSSCYASGATRSAIKQTTGIQNLDLDAFLSERVLVPNEQTQRAVAKLLEAETARIDALVDKKRRMIGLLEERKSLLFSRLLEDRGFRWGSSLDSPAAAGNVPAGWKVAHLSAMLEQLTNGYVGPTRDLLVDDGIKYIQSLHIKDGEIDFSRGPYYVPSDWHDERPRIHLRQGDVLIVQTGDIGQVAVVQPGFGPASCHALQIARVRPDLLLGDYLGAYLRSPFGRQSLLSRVTGALHPHLEGGIRDIPIVAPPLRVQSDIVDELRGSNALIDRLRFDVARQIVLLREHRQALISSAVTGNLDVAKAAA